MDDTEVPGEEKNIGVNYEDGEGNGEVESKEGANDDGEAEDDDEDSDEDNVNVVIGDISKSAPTYTNLNIHKRGAVMAAGKV